MFGLVKGSRVEDGNTVPTGLDLNRKVLLETHGCGAVVENSLEWSVLKSGTIDVTRNPIIIKDRGTLSS